MAKFKAAVVQASSGPDTAATIDKAVDLIAQCGARGATVAVFPEAFVGGYPKGASFDIAIGVRTPEGRDEFREYYDRSITVPGPETGRLGEATRKAGLFAAIGVIERDGGTLYCTIVFLGPDGQYQGKHRKLMPTAAERLCWGFGDGSTLTTVPTPWGKLGAVICWENYMPLLRTAMYAQDISIYCAPTADDRDSWVSTMQHVALEGRCFVLSACQYMLRSAFQPHTHNRITDESDAVLMRGGSMIIDPLGRIVAGPDFSGETILVAELDTDDRARGKFDFDVVGHYARADVFRLAVEDRPMVAVAPVARKINGQGTMAAADTAPAQRTE
ncbi:carbon-nitrogen hydrolase family protein [Bordetella sp. N]|uniref:carbon-nitrogen hydrolase family protein n=1 Tax=Bordetella sp. N TaxID=1746199 RepID=UPI00070C85E3|nr:carbon-nitrogen hydrolase family protein [Bordetella sp. N]ALM82703.1 nitrilase [Bordetella sp. N]